MSNIFLGDSSIDAVYLGDSLADAVYLGDNKVWPTGTPVSPMGMQKQSSGQTVSRSASVYEQLTGMVARPGYLGPTANKLIANGSATGKTLNAQLRWNGIANGVLRGFMVARNGSEIDRIETNTGDATMTLTIPGVNIDNFDEFMILAMSNGSLSSQRLTSSGSLTYLYWD